jgi:hypothetical protein
LEVLKMTRLEEVEEVISSLSEKEYREFRRWFLERDWEKWDRQIQENSEAERLGFLVTEALEAKKSGHLKDL